MLTISSTSGDVCGEGCVRGKAECFSGELLDMCEFESSFFDLLNGDGDGDGG